MQTTHSISRLKGTRRAWEAVDVGHKSWDDLILPRPDGV